MKKKGQKRFAAGFLAALLFLGLGRGMALASYENPYQYPKTIRLRGEEKAAYLDQKTWAMFTGKTRAICPPMIRTPWTMWCWESGM